MPAGLLFKVRQIDIAVVVAFNDHDLHARQDGAGWVGAMGGGGDEADIALSLATGLMIASDRQQAGILAL